MNRRKFASSALELVLSEDTAQTKRTIEVVENKFANKVLPKVQRTSAGIEPYAGPWGSQQAAHLLRRTMFGVRKADLNTILQTSLDGAISLLLTPAQIPSPPLNTNSNDPDVPVGQTWINAPSNSSNSSRNTSLKSWWISHMLNQPISIWEKMVLFWHNHYASESVETKDARFSYRQNDLFRQHALGNFKDLTRLVTLDPAMLRYLNGNTNTKTNPNENYARELQELFTIGKGPEIGPGNYTNYTEADVIAASRVLTGWRDNGTTLSSYFTLSRHDTNNKQFSSAYGSTLIVGSSDATGMTEVNALLDMIFAQPETARYFCRKLYRWFVYYVIDPATETNVIEPLANILRTNNYDILPVLQTLLKSAHFFDSVNMGCMIKSPVDLTVGTCRMLNVVFPDASNLTRQYNHWKYIRTESANMQMDLCDPPNVAGWPSYYQLPQFYEIWINSDTLPKRSKFVDTIITTGYTQNSFTLVGDAIAFAQQVSTPGDPNALVSELSGLVFPIVITDNQKTFLKGILIPGLPDYEWTNEWNAYLADPTDPNKSNAVKSKLQALLSFMMSMPEYQLA